MATLFWLTVLGILFCTLPAFWSGALLVLIAGVAISNAEDSRRGQ
jgi:ABC-type dipeptide/oligopeptide/nickel transport system permease component